MTIVRIEPVFVDATRVETDEGRISIYLWLDVPKDAGGNAAGEGPLRLWVELEWEKKAGGRESLKVYEEPVPWGWMKLQTLDRRLKGRVKLLFDEAREEMFASGCEGTMQWAKEWMLSGRPPRAGKPAGGAQSE